MRLRPWLDANKMTNQQFADLCGVAKCTIDRVARGDQTPSLALGVRIAEVTKELDGEGVVTASDLLPEEPAAIAS
jgi:transcriptional regulator with XRE-family HTH domain